MCTVQLPPGGNPLAVNKYIIIVIIVILQTAKATMATSIVAGPNPSPLAFPHQDIPSVWFEAA
jgi:hypothetical protein